MMMHALYQHCVADSLNPFYQRNLGLSRGFVGKLAGRLPVRARAGGAIAATAGMMALAWVAFGHVPPWFDRFLHRWVDYLIALLVLLSYITPVKSIHEALSRATRSNALQPLLLTELSEGELMRGIVVPVLSKAYPQIFAAALLTLVWPFFTFGYNLTHRILLFAFFCNIVVNHAAVAWIVFGFAVRGAKGVSLAFAAFFLMMLDPFLLAWENRLFFATVSWSPLVLSFALMEILYCCAKAGWAYLMITDLKSTFRSDIVG